MDHAPSTPTVSPETLVEVHPSALGRYLLAGLVGVGAGLVLGWYLGTLLADDRAGHYRTAPREDGPREDATVESVVTAPPEDEAAGTVETPIEES